MSRQRVEGERARPFQTPRYRTLYPPTHFKRKSERDLTRAQERVAAERRGRVGTAVPDTAASYTQPRGPDPRTTAHGSRTERESGHGCARHRGIIHSNERGGGARLCQIPRHHTRYPRPTSIVTREKGVPAYNRAWRQKEEEERARLCQTLRHHTLNREGLTRAQQRMAAESRGRVGTAVPDAAASYTQTRGGVRSGHGCARYRGIINSNERGGAERARLCQNHTLNREDVPRTQQRVAAERVGRVGTAVPDAAASYLSLIHI